MQKAELIHRYEKRLLNADIYSVLANSDRRKMLFTLYNKKMFYTQIAERLSAKGKSLTSYNLKFLSRQHLINYNKIEKTYNITVRGMKVVNAMRLIDESEMFIIDLGDE